MQKLECKEEVCPLNNIITLRIFVKMLDKFNASDRVMLDGIRESLEAYIDFFQRDIHLIILGGRKETIDRYGAVLTALKRVTGTYFVNLNMKEIEEIKDIINLIKSLLV